MPGLVLGVGGRGSRMIDRLIDSSIGRSAPSHEWTDGLAPSLLLPCARPYASPTHFPSFLPYSLGTPTQDDLGGQGPHRVRAPHRVPDDGHDRHARRQGHGGAGDAGGGQRGGPLPDHCAGRWVGGSGAVVFVRWGVGVFIYVVWCVFGPASPTSTATVISHAHTRNPSPNKQAGEERNHHHRYRPLDITYTQSQSTFKQTGEEGGGGVPRHPGGALQARLRHSARRRHPLPAQGTMKRRKRGAHIHTYTQGPID